MNTKILKIDANAEFFSTQEEKALQEALLGIRARYGKNSILKGMNFEEAATGRERNEQIGGHKANGTSKSTHAAI